MKNIKLGFIPLTDCAPLVIADKMGMFEKNQLNVELVKEASWANIRDKVAAGALDGAQMLATMPIATSLGIGGPVTPMLTAMVMDLNGNAITISNKLYDTIQASNPESLNHRPVTAVGLKQIIEQMNLAGEQKLRFAMVFPTSTHNYELRYWLASAGIDPDNDIELIVIPPQQMVDNLASGNIDGFCVGEPWNGLAVKQGLGHTLITKYELWNNSPEKVFGVTRKWAEENPETHIAILKSLLEAARWLDESKENRISAASILCQESCVNADIDVIKMSMTGTFQYNQDAPPEPMDDFNVFYRYSANFPWRSHAIWFISQMIRWGHIRNKLPINDVVNSIYRPDIFRDAIGGFGITMPEIDYKIEGVHAKCWELPHKHGELIMGPDLFFDKKDFDAKKVASYIESFEIKHLKMNIHNMIDD